MKDSPKPKRIFDIREGDTWGVVRNNGTHVRDVVRIGLKHMSYRHYGSREVHVCLISTFLNWCRTGSLEFRSNESHQLGGGEAMIKDEAMKICPYCGNDEFYRKMRMSGFTEYRYRFDGKDAENAHIHDCLNYKESKASFCASCQKPLRIRSKP